MSDPSHEAKQALALAEAQRQHFPVLGTLQLLMLRRNYVRFRT